jgi:hypothetical protein
MIATVHSDRPFSDVSGTVIGIASASILGRSVYSGVDAFRGRGKNKEKASADESKS